MGQLDGLVDPPPPAEIPSAEGNDVLILDGGFATQLTKYIEEPVDGNPLWSAKFLASNPEACVQTHLDFLRAGADVIITNTYQASIPGFSKYLGIGSHKAHMLIREAVSLAKRAVEIYQSENPNESHTPLVAGSIGPYGAFLHDYSEYTGSYVDNTAPEIINNFHRPRIEALIDGGCDLLACETIPAEAESLWLAELLKEFPEMRAWFTFQCKDKSSTAHGEFLNVVAQKLERINPTQLIGVGMNCLSPALVQPLASSIAPLSIPLVAYPNSGEQYVEGKWVPGDSKNIHSMETYVPSWLDAGVRLVGGCCRTYADDVSLIKKKVTEWRAQRIKKQTPKAP